MSIKLQLAPPDFQTFLRRCKTYNNKKKQEQMNNLFFVFIYSFFRHMDHLNQVINLILLKYF